MIQQTVPDSGGMQPQQLFLVNTDNLYMCQLIITCLRLHTNYTEVSVDVFLRFLHIQVTSEMLGNKPMVYHHVRFNSKYHRGMILPIQYGSECHDGYIQPIPKLFNLTNEKDLCIEHRLDAVRCFAQLAIERIRDQYDSIEHYQV